MTSVLFLVHRIPFPPNKGDKIRSFHLLKQLAQHHEVHLGAFVDDDADWQHGAELKRWCAESYLRPLRPGMKRFTSLRGLLSGEPLTLPYYRDRKMAEWVNQKLVLDGIDRVVIFSAAMAQYVLGEQMESRERIVDLVDVDSEKWREYAPRHRWPMSWIYNRESALLLKFERSIASQCDATVLVSPQEAQLFRELAPESSKRIHSIHNGVDTGYFSPDHCFSSPYDAGSQVLVFTGAMDYWANVDAVTWFAEAVFPQLRAAVPRAQFYIVGARPTDQVRRLARNDGVTVTGSVHDIRPYLAYAAAAVAPLRIARGIQNKVLEAMAMAKPVLATPAAIDGIQAPEELRSLVCERPEQFVELARQLLADGDLRALGQIGRHTVVKHYSWAESFSQFDSLLSAVARQGVAVPEGTSPTERAGSAIR